MNQKLSKDMSVIVTDEVINTSSHIVGTILAIFGSALLITQVATAQKWWHLAGFIAYGVGLVGLFTLSSLHHGINGSDKTNRRLRTLDYIAIYGLIVGTVAPICLVMFRGIAGYATLGTIILVAAFGITIRSIYINLPGYISQTLYIVMGWLPILLPITTGINFSVGGLALLLGGGLFYTAGAIVFGAEKPNLIPGKFGFHEIWHISVLLGALCHYVFLYKYILPMS